MNIVTIADSDGNTYTLTSDNPNVLAYADLWDGNALVVMKVKLEDLKGVFSREG